MFKEHSKCQRCGYNEFQCSLTFHHIDHNKENNSPENFMLLCVNCHWALHFNKWDGSTIPQLDNIFNLSCNRYIPYKKDPTYKELKKIKCFWNGGTRRRYCRHKNIRCQYRNPKECEYYKEFIQDDETTSK